MGIDLSRANEINDKIVAYDLHNKGLRHDLPTGVEAYSLQDMLEAGRIVRQEANGKSKMTCDDLFVATLYVLLHASKNETDEDDETAILLADKTHGVALLDLDGFELVPDDEDSDE